MDQAPGTGPQLAQDLLASLRTTQASADPYPVYARLHQLGPVHRSSAGTVFVTGYDQCAAIVRDPAFGAQSPRWNDIATPGWRDRPGLVATFETMLFRDPPEHTRLRRLVSGVFSPRHADRMRAQVRRLVSDALDTLADAGAAGSPVDLQEILAGSLPIAVIAAIVGVPRADWPALRAAITALLQVVELTAGPAALAEADAAAVALRDYFTALVAARRAAPEDDLTSDLAAIAAAPAPGGGPACTEDELLQTLTFVFMAGVDTMTNLLANGTAAFLAHPAQAALLRAEPGRGPAAVEEVLRYDPPVQLVARIAAAGASVGGVEVSAGELVVAVLGAAGRDPARYQRPGAFDIARTQPGPVLAFGGGLHYCLGAPLARVEADCFFSALLARFPRLRLAGTPARSGMVFRGFSQLPVCW
ncbi:MAG TPA: cytochrome P450 [Streptosporangiaceae bacterium]|jgi:cytochrome P450